MTTRQRELKPDPRGWYRPRIGWVRWDGKPTQPRFNLGTDRKEAERRYAKIQELYEENCRVNGEDQWSPRALGFARELASGKKVVEYPPPSDENGLEDPQLEYAQMMQVDQQHFPSLQLVPSDHAKYAESVKLNERLMTSRLRELEAELRELGALVGQSGVPDRLVTGTLHEALDAYAESVRRDGAKLPSGELKPYQRLRIVKVERLKREHADVPLHSLGYDQCASMVHFWRNRPVTMRGTRSSRDNSRHHIGELFRFFRWLDATSQFRWAMPRGITMVSRRVEKFESEKKLSAVTKPTYTPEQLAVINRHANPFERLALYVGLNCAMGAAELGRLVVSDCLLHRAHPHAARLGFESTGDDSFLRYFRPKTEVFGEWLLWPETTEMVRWGVERAGRMGVDLLFTWDTGEPIYDEALKNPQAGFANIWTRLLERVRKSHPAFPELPFGTLRDTLPDLLRRDYSDDLASLCLAHGTPSKADSLLECYSNKPFGRFHQALRQVREHFAPMFAAVRDPFDDAKHYLPVAVKERIAELLRQNKGTTEIARECGVSRMTVLREKKKLTPGAGRGASGRQVSGTAHP